MEYLGYSDGTFTENIGTYRIVFMAYFISVVILITFKVLKEKMLRLKCFGKLFDWLSSVLFWNGIIFILTLGCM